MIKETDVIAVDTEVAETTGFHHHKTIQKVVRVTASGQIVLSNGNRYNREGYGSRGDDRWGSRASIEILTDAMRSEIKRRENIEFLSSFRFEKLNNEALEHVAEVIKKAGKQ